jgi:hypothetical protein
MLSRISFQPFPKRGRCFWPMQHGIARNHSNFFSILSAQLTSRPQRAEPYSFEMGAHQGITGTSWNSASRPGTSPRQHFQTSTAPREESPTSALGAQLESGLNMSALGDLSPRLGDARSAPASPRAAMVKPKKSVMTGSRLPARPVS